jgi:hypothetical protein
LKDAIPPIATKVITNTYSNIMPLSFLAFLANFLAAHVARQCLNFVSITTSPVVKEYYLLAPSPPHHLGQPAQAQRRCRIHFIARWMLRLRAA